MSNPAHPNPPPNILGTIAGIIGLLGAFLYFTGWIYRWAYYAFYQLEVATLDLPLESFLLVPLQVLFGNPKAILKTVIVVLLAPFLIQITLWLLTNLGNAIHKKFQTLIIPLSNPSRSGEIWNSFISFSFLKFNSIQLLRSLLDEIIIVLWILFLLFWLAHNQGLADARRDAINQTSTLPVVTFITPEKSLLLGRKLEIIEGKIPLDPSLKGYHVIGDLELFKTIRGTETNDLKEERVWRLLLEQGGWIYLFPTLPTDADWNQRPPVIAIPKTDAGQLLILSPEPPQPD